MANDFIRNRGGEWTIHAFLSEISTKWNTISLVQDFNNTKVSSFAVITVTPCVISPSRIRICLFFCKYGGRGRPEGSLFNNFYTEV